MRAVLQQQQEKQEVEKEGGEKKAREETAEHFVEAILRILGDEKQQHILTVFVFLHRSS